MNGRCSVLLMESARSQAADVLLEVLRYLEGRDAIDLEVGNHLPSHGSLAVDILHTIGEPAAALEFAATMPTRGVWVHTVDRLEHDPRHVRGRHGWAWRERHGLSRPTRWLAHGRAAARVLVDSGTAPGERVICLPLLPPLVTEQLSTPGTAGLAWRRDREIPVGMRLVVAVGPQQARFGCNDLDEAMARIDPRSTMAAWVATEAHGPKDERLSRVSIFNADEAQSIVCAADALLSLAHQLEATTVAALTGPRGVPLVAAASDSGSELVIAGTTGTVVPPSRPDALAAAVRNVLDRGPVRIAAAPGLVERSIPRLARTLLNAYGAAAEWNWHSPRTFSAAAL